MNMQHMQHSGYFNLKTGSVLSPGNCTASLVRNILSFNSTQDLLNLSKTFSTWIYDIISVQSLSAVNRDKQCQMLLAIGLDGGKRSIWHKTLLSMSIGEISIQASGINILLQSFMKYLLSGKIQY